MGTVTGPEHYTAALHSLSDAADHQSGSDAQRYYLGDALVHANLAVAAATALAASLTPAARGSSAWAAWMDVLS